MCFECTIGLVEMHSTCGTCLHKGKFFQWGTMLWHYGGCSIIWHSTLIPVGCHQPEDYHRLHTGEIPQVGVMSGD